jgi:glycosyltransferase involved in cell wall biosynthesis
LGKSCPASDWSLQALLQESSFSLALLVQNFRWGITVPEHYLGAIRQQSPSTRILILSDESGESAARRAELTQQLEHYELAQDRAAREREAFAQADLVITRSPGAQKRWLEREPAIAVETVPTSYPLDSVNYSWRTRKGVLAWVDLGKSGDVDGLVWFLENVWATVRKAKGVELLVAGGDQIPEDSRRALPEVKWFPAADIEELAAAARLFVAPQRFGATDFVGQMLACGLPGVATSLAADSAGLERSNGILVADSAAEFSSAVARLHGDEGLGRRLASLGLEHARQEFSADNQRARLQAALSRVLESPPKQDPATPFSANLVDSLYSSRLLTIPPEQRVASRLDIHVELAWEFLRMAKPRQARQQLRHVFSWLGESVQSTAPLARLLSVLARCYRELGEPAMVEGCVRKARQCFSSQAQRRPAAPAASSRPSTPKISLIVPTYNRLPILRKCLAALEAQTLPLKEIEVIVIDDGSSDETEESMRQYQAPFRFQYLRQANSGTGAARRNGVAHARGEYLLLMNDDTICDPDLIEQHLRVHANLASERWAVLGNFEYPLEARRRAMTHFLRTGSFMFPQIDMEAGFPYPYSHFITCNLSIRRQAVIEAGSFDSTYKLSEDTELGIRLFEMGYGVLYHPAAHAWHDHLPYAVPNLIRRARVYGADYFHMFRRHPRVLREWAMPANLAGMEASAADAISAYLERNRTDVAAAVAALERWDALEFEPVLAKPAETAQVISLFQRAVPAIHWFYLLETMLETMRREMSLGFSKNTTTAASQSARPGS